METATIFSDSTDIYYLRPVDELAIVILNWNGRQLLEKFIPDVVKHSPGASIVLADNASSDDSITFIKDNYPEVKIVQNDQNYGFAEGYNRALRSVNAELVLLLNSDILVSEGWLSPLLQTMKDPNVAGCQPKILSYNSPEHFEHAGASGGFIDRNYYPFCRGRIFDHSEIDTGQYDDAREIFWATGAALLIRKDLFNQVNGFDVDFFAHMEEIDLCWRIKKQGYKFMVVPKSVVYHLGGGTLPYTSPRKVYLNFRNNLMMLIKNHPGPLFPKLFWRMSLDGMAAIRFFVRGEFRNFIAVFNAHMYQYAHLKTLLKKRREIKRTVTNENFSGVFQGSIIWNYYFKKVHNFSELNQRLFRK